MIPQTFIKQFALWSLSLTVIVFLTNCYVLFGSSKFLASEERVGKVIKLKLNPPDCAILGTSRARYGYNPDHAFFPKSTYNASAAAINLQELDLYTDFLIHTCKIKELFIAIDYMMFCSDQVVDPGFHEIIENEYKIIQYLFSWDVFKKAFKRLKREPYLENGYRKAKKVSTLALKKGYNKNRRMNVDSIVIFKSILNKLYKNDIKVTMVFNPSSALCWEDMALWGWFDDWLDWKKQVVKINTSIAGNLRKPPFPIYDFAIYNKYTTELSPTKAGSYLRYHRDMSHFNGTLGNLVLDALQSGKLNDLGVKLDAGNIDGHLVNFRKTRSYYLPQLIEFTQNK